MTLTRAAFVALVGRTGRMSPAYAEDVLVRVAHHSAAIEGNTLSVADTITLLVDELTPTAGRPLRELYEVANHREAFATVLEHAGGDQPLTAHLIRRLHAELMDHIHDDRGQWKTTQNAILGSTVETATPAQVPWLVEQWAENASWQASNLHGAQAVTALAGAHADFERIHPFADGNGRTGRMLLMWQSLRAFGVPIVIEVSQRAAYIEALRTDARDDLDALLAGRLLNELERATQFPPPPHG
jgi:Fic family protein